MLDVSLARPEVAPETYALPAACVPWPCALGRICAAHAPRISPADAAPLIAIFRSAPEAVAYAA
jgi:hypothetical protein